MPHETKVFNGSVTSVKIIVHSVRRTPKRASGQKFDPSLKKILLKLQSTCKTNKNKNSTFKKKMKE